MPIQQVGRNGPDGTTIGADGTELAGMHGVAVAQATVINTLIAAGTLVSVVARLNQVILTLRNKGLNAAS